MIVKVVVPDSIYAQVYFARGEQGPTGATGATGATGPQGDTGPQGPTGGSATHYHYKAKTNSTTGDPTSGKVIWNNTTQSSSTVLNVSHIDSDTTDVSLFLDLIAQNDIIILQDENNSANYQKWQVSGSPTYATTYDSFPVTLIASGGLGTTNFSNNHSLIVVLVNAGATGPQGPSGVVSVTAPITNTGTSTAANIGIDQTGLTLAQSQVTGLVTALSGTAKLASANAFTVGGHTITSETIGIINLSLNLISGQTAVPFRIRNAANNGDVFQVDTSGQLRLPSILNPNSFSNCRIQIQDTGLKVDTGVAANVPLRVQNTNASPTGNLTEWLNPSGGSVLARVDSNGNFRANIVQTIGAGADLREGTGGGGLVTLIKMAAAAVNPGANLARLYFRDGTTAGTLKLVVRAGAAGAETTILDNIPQ